MGVEQRGSGVRILAEEGDPNAEVAANLVAELYELVRRGHALHPSDVEHAIRILRTDPGADLGSYFEDTILQTVEGRALAARSAGQRRYVELLRTREIVFGVGPAGTGKTYLAMAVADGSTPG